MLRKRSRTVSSSKQSLMFEPLSLQSPTGKHSRPSASSLFASPRLFVGLSAKSIISDCEAAMSPTSILETKPFSSIANPFFSDKNPRKPHPDAAAVAAQTVSAESKHRPWENGDSRAIGLGIVDALDQPDKKSARPDSRMVLFGSRLKIQIPSINAASMDSPHSTIEFGVKNKNSQLALLSPARRSPIGFANVVGDAPPLPSPGVFTGCLSASEMEMSEDYTCVIAHGPNPRTTHIFDNCIVESCGGSFTPSWRESRFLTDHSSCHADDFLAFCYACKKRLGQGKDIFMYRGEKAFCSSECRYQEMMFDEGMEKASSSVSSASL